MKFYLVPEREKRKTPRKERRAMRKEGRETMWKTETEGPGGVLMSRSPRDDLPSVGHERQHLDQSKMVRIKWKVKNRVTGK